MARIVIECSDPNDLEAVELAAEQFQGKCNVTYFRQAQAMVEAGTASSERQAIRRIAEETGDSVGSVKMRVQRGKKVAQGEAPGAESSARGRFTRPKIPKQPSTRDEIYTTEFKAAFESLFVILKNAKRLRWKSVSREAAMKYLAVLYDLITIN